LGQIHPLLETCNNVDDDCNGLVDDAPGCVVTCAPSPEICNGADDDCDGLVDEGHFCGGSGENIHSIQDESIPPGTTVTLEGVFVTSVARIASGVEFYVQEPSGASSHPYPRFAGIRVFVSASEAVTLGDLAQLQVGDCVNLGGTVGEFLQGTQLQGLTSLVKGGACGDISPTQIDDACQIATDVDPLTPGDQPTPSAEMLEGTLIHITNVVVVSQPDLFGLFRVTPPSESACSLLIDLRNSGDPQLVVGNVISVTGIYNQQATYRLLPRVPSDLQY
jgi:hypothetical protein